MPLHQFAIRLTSAHGPLDARRVTPSGLQGVFHHVVALHDARAATWLHDHPAPKPYTLAAAHYDRQQRQMAGLLVSTLSDDAAECIIAAWRAAWEQGRILRFGAEGSRDEQPCAIVELMPVDTTTFSRLLAARPLREVAFDFLTPTSFRQNQGELLLPVPRNVFARPYEVWQAYAPADDLLPDDWLDWCDRNVFCTHHNIRTVQSNVNRERQMRGFVGQASFRAIADRRDERDHHWYGRVLSALGHFATFSGIGRKTTVGMGAVELRQAGE